MTVDLIQSSKKTFINLYITNPEVKQAWHEYVDKQTDFIHCALSTGNKVSSALKNELESYFSSINTNWDSETAQLNKKSQ